MVIDLLLSKKVRLTRSKTALIFHQREGVPLLEQVRLLGRIRYFIPPERPCLIIKQSTSIKMNYKTSLRWIQQVHTSWAIMKNFTDWYLTSLNKCDWAIVPVRIGESSPFVSLSCSFLITHNTGCHDLISIT